MNSLKLTLLALTLTLSSASAFAQSNCNCEVVRPTIESMTAKICALSPTVLGNIAVVNGTMDGYEACKTKSDLENAQASICSGAPMDLQTEFDFVSKLYWAAPTVALKDQVFAIQSELDKMLSE